VRHFPRFKFIVKCIDPEAGEINKLVGYHHITPPDLFPEAAASRCRKNKFTAQLFQRIDVGPVVDLGRGDGMISAVAGQDIHLACPDGTRKKS